MNYFINLWAPWQLWAQSTTSGVVFDWICTLLLLLLVPHHFCKRYTVQFSSQKIISWRKVVTEWMGERVKTKVILWIAYSNQKWYFGLAWYCFMQILIQYFIQFKDYPNVETWILQSYEPSQQYIKYLHLFLRPVKSIYSQLIQQLSGLKHGNLNSGERLLYHKIFVRSRSWAENAVFLNSIF
jgi:hypothetical protein